MFRKFISLILSLAFLFQQTGFAQAAMVELNLAAHLGHFMPTGVADRFRPMHLRYFSYDNLTDDFKILLDKGDNKEAKAESLEGSTKELLKYFLIGITLPNDTFWVNLRPDSPDQIIDDRLSQTDIGKIMLEADLQLKKDTAGMTSPATPEGKIYWDKLYKKASDLYGNEPANIPTLTRPWIVPGEVIIRETADSSRTRNSELPTNPSAYIYKATLKVMLEQDYLQQKEGVSPLASTYSFPDERAKELNEYSTQLIRELIIPKLTKEVNNSKRYAALRQVFYSLILARWFKLRYQGKPGVYPSRIDTQNLTQLTSLESWSKDTYFKAYQDSFKNGEYRLQETVYTPTGQAIRSYFSGGIAAQKLTITTDTSSPITGLTVPHNKNDGIFQSLSSTMLPLSGNGGSTASLIELIQGASTATIDSSMGIETQLSPEEKAMAIARDIVYYPTSNLQKLATNVFLPMVEEFRFILHRDPTDPEIIGMYRKAKSIFHYRGINIQDEVRHIAKMTATQIKDNGSSAESPIVKNWLSEEEIKGLYVSLVSNLKTEGYASFSNPEKVLGILHRYIIEVLRTMVRFEERRGVAIGMLRCTAFRLRGGATVESDIQRHLEEAAIASDSRESRLILNNSLRITELIQKTSIDLQKEVLVKIADVLDQAADKLKAESLQSDSPITAKAGQRSNDSSPGAVIMNKEEKELAVALQKKLTAGDSTAEDHLNKFIKVLPGYNESNPINNIELRGKFIFDKFEANLITVRKISKEIRLNKVSGDLFEITLANDLANSSRFCIIRLNYNAVTVEAYPNSLALFNLESLAKAILSWIDSKNPSAGLAITREQAVKEFIRNSLNESQVFQDPKLVDAIMGKLEYFFEQISSIYPSLERAKIVAYFFARYLIDYKIDKEDLQAPLRFAEGLVEYVKKLGIGLDKDTLELLSETSARVMYEEVQQFPLTKEQSFILGGYIMASVRNDVLSGQIKSFKHGASQSFEDIIGQRGIPIVREGQSYNIHFFAEKATLEGLCSVPALLTQARAIGAQLGGFEIVAFDSYPGLTDIQKLNAPLGERHRTALDLDTYFLAWIIKEKQEGNTNKDLEKAYQAVEALLAFHASNFAQFVKLFREGRIRSFEGVAKAELPEWQDISVLELGGGMFEDENLRQLYVSVLDKELAKLGLSDIKVFPISESRDAALRGAALLIPQEKRKGQKVIAVDIGATSYKVGVIQCDANGNLQEMLEKSVTEKTSVSKLGGRSGYYVAIRNKIFELADQYGISRGSIYIGVSHPGKKMDNGKIAPETNPNMKDNQGVLEDIDPLELLDLQGAWANDAYVQALAGYDVIIKNQPDLVTQMAGKKVMYVGFGGGVGTAFLEVDADGITIVKNRDSHVQHDPAFGKILAFGKNADISASPIEKKVGASSVVTAIERAFNYWKNKLSNLLHSDKDSSGSDISADTTDKYGESEVTWDEIAPELQGYKIINMDVIKEGKTTDDDRVQFEMVAPADDLGGPINQKIEAIGTSYRWATDMLYFAARKAQHEIYPGIEKFKSLFREIAKRNDNHFKPITTSVASAVSNQERYTQVLNQMEDVLKNAISKVKEVSLNAAITLKDLEHVLEQVSTWKELLLSEPQSLDTVTKTLLEDVIEPMKLILEHTELTKASLALPSHATREIKDIVEQSITDLDKLLKSLQEISDKTSASALSDSSNKAYDRNILIQSPLSKEQIGNIEKFISDSIKTGGIPFSQNTKDILQTQFIEQLDKLNFNVEEAQAFVEIVAAHVELYVDVLKKQALHTPDPYTYTSERIKLQVPIFMRREYPLLFNSYRWGKIQDNIVNLVQAIGFSYESDVENRDKIVKIIKGSVTPEVLSVAGSALENDIDSLLQEINKVLNEIGLDNSVIQNAKQKFKVLTEDNLPGIKSTLDKLYKIENFLNIQIFLLGQDIDNPNNQGVKEKYTELRKQLSNIKDNNLMPLFVELRNKSLKSSVSLRLTDANTIEATGGVDSSTSSPSTPDMSEFGGVDFGGKFQPMPFTIQTLGNFQGLTYELPELSSSALAAFDLNKYKKETEAMLEAGMPPSASSVIEYIAVCRYKGEFETRRKDVVRWLTQMGILEEMDCSESSVDFRQALVLADSV